MSPPHDWGQKLFTECDLGWRSGQYVITYDPKSWQLTGSSELKLYHGTFTKQELENTNPVSTLFLERSFAGREMMLTFEDPPASSHALQHMDTMPNSNLPPRAKLFAGDNPRVVRGNRDSARIRKPVKDVPPLRGRKYGSASQRSNLDAIPELARVKPKPRAHSKPRHPTPPATQSKHVVRPTSDGEQMRRPPHALSAAASAVADYDAKKKWTCTECTYLNAVTDQKCAMCDTSNPSPPSCSMCSDSGLIPTSFTLLGADPIACTCKGRAVRRRLMRRLQNL